MNVCSSLPAVRSCTQNRVWRGTPPFCLLLNTFFLFCGFSFLFHIPFRYLFHIRLGIFVKLPFRHKYMLYPIVFNNKIEYLVYFLNGKIQLSCRQIKRVLFLKFVIGRKITGDEQYRRIIL